MKRNLEMWICIGKNHSFANLIAPRRRTKRRYFSTVGEYSEILRNEKKFEIVSRKQHTRARRYEHKKFPTMSVQLLSRVSVYGQWLLFSFLSLSLSLSFSLSLSSSRSNSRFKLLADINILLLGMFVSTVGGGGGGIRFSALSRKLKGVPRRPRTRPAAIQSPSLISRYPVSRFLYFYRGERPASSSRLVSKLPIYQIESTCSSIGSRLLRNLILRG